MNNDLVINQGAFNLGLQALRRAGKDEIADQLESDCECIPDEIKRLNEKLELVKKEIRYAIAHAKALLSFTDHGGRNG